MNVNSISVGNVIIYNGLYSWPGLLPTASAAAWANSLLSPTTKVSNVSFGSNVCWFFKIVLINLYYYKKSF